MKMKNLDPVNLDNLHELLGLVRSMEDALGKNCQNIMIEIMELECRIGKIKKNKKGE